MQRDTIENQLFDWETWDANSPGDLQFGDVTLKVQIGEFPAGTKFQSAFWIGTNSLLVLMDDKDQEHLYDLKVSVGEKVDPDTIPHAEGCGCGEHEPSN